MKLERNNKKRTQQYLNTNIKFINSINNKISTNKKEIIFEDEEYKKEIPVNKETKELICIANLIKDKVKVNLQFTKQ